MKAKLFGMGLLVATIATVLLYPSIRGNASLNPADRPPADPLANRAKVEVVFVLDTTGSMSGLIATAKEKIWSIATTMSQADPAPQIKMGLVAYRDRGDAYVTRVADLTEDLDSLYATLMDYRAEGGGDGPESVNLALDDAIQRISWSQDPSSYKVVFLVGDAPPHMDYQGEHQYPQIVAAAAEKGIVVNTIQCGDVPATTGPWQQIARLGHGRYFTVAQAGGAVRIDTPFDAEIARLSQQVDATRLYYGTKEERAAMDLKQAATDKLHEVASAAAQARRAVFNATASGFANLLGRHELVDDVASGRADVAAIPADQLPEPLADLSPEKRQEVVEEKAQQRKDLQRRIRTLAEQRQAFIAGKVEESGGAAASLDRQIYEAVRAQAATKGLSYENGPEY